MKLLIKNRHACDGQYCQLLENVALLDIQMTSNRWENSIFRFNEKSNARTSGDDLNQTELVLHKISV